MITGRISRTLQASRIDSLPLARRGSGPFSAHPKNASPEADVLLQDVCPPLGLTVWVSLPPEQSLDTGTGSRHSLQGGIWRFLQEDGAGISRNDAAWPICTGSKQRNRVAVAPEDTRPGRTGIGTGNSIPRCLGHVTCVSSSGFLRWLLEVVTSRWPPSVIEMPELP